MVFQPIGVGMKKDEPALLAKVNETLCARWTRPARSTSSGTSGSGPNTEYKMTRDDKVVAARELKFTPLP